jgi:hypothetical protein
MFTYRQLLEAVDCCHNNGVVHRDLKPSNIIVTPERRAVVQKDDEDRSGADRRTPSEKLKTRIVVLIDFGTGHLLGAPPVTSPGTLVGTAEYLPPWYVKELLAGATGKRPVRPYKAEPADDVYQLGVLLYALLTGSLPTRTPSTQPLQLLEEIRDVVPLHPRELNPSAPEALSRLAMRCLEKRSTKLPPDAAALRREWLAAMNEDGEALRVRAPEFLARQETTLAETPVQAEQGGGADEAGRGSSAGIRATAAELLASEVRQLARLTRTSHWASLAAILALVMVTVRAEFRAQREDARIGRVEARQASGGESSGSDVRDVQPPSMIEESRPGPVAANPPAVPPVRRAASGGLKMPDKPKAIWLRPGKDGICRNSKTGEELRTQAVIRGTCWEVGRKLPGEPSCPQGTYDPPPEILKDPKVPDLHRSCFIPWVVDDANALVPH